jgi:hypothetical protein
MFMFHLYIVQYHATRFLTLSNGCSLPALARPPKRSDEPRTRSKLDSIEPKSDHLRISSFSLRRAKSAMISSGTFPQVAFRSPPAATKIITRNY